MPQPQLMYIELCVCIGSTLSIIFDRFHNSQLNNITISLVPLNIVTITMYYCGVMWFYILACVYGKHIFVIVDRVVYIYVLCIPSKSNSILIA